MEALLIEKSIWIYEKICTFSSFGVVYIDSSLVVCDFLAGTKL
jgi:hypothetical protein